jgi:hypothetical protein
MKNRDYIRWIIWRRKRSKNVRYLNETEKRHWDNIAKQFPYQFKQIDLHIALAFGVVLGLMVGLFFGLAI